MSYIDGYLIPVPVANKEAYLRASGKFWEMAKDCGALHMIENWGDDIPDGVTTSFPMAVKLEPGETLVFSWTVWPDKASRDAGNAKMREHPGMADMEMPFDGKRMIYAGFERLVEY